MEARDIEGGEIGESMKESRKKRESWIPDCERESNTVGDGEKLFRDELERFQAMIVIFEEFEDTFPTLIW